MYAFYTWMTYCDFSQMCNNVALRCNAIASKIVLVCWYSHSVFKRQLYIDSLANRHFSFFQLSAYSCQTTYAISAAHAKRYDNDGLLLVC